MRQALETELLRKVQLAAPEYGFRLFRNNIGALKDSTGRVIKYGLCNPGGADLIGWVPTIITPAMVGTTVARFSAIEIKSPTGHVTQEQRQFLSVVHQAGGVASEVYTLEQAGLLLGDAKCI